jgi:putative endonuclease
MYILECSDGSYYTGSTKDLERRLWEHQNGLGANHTAKRLPVKLVYCEECDRINDAFYREKQVQGWSRKKKEALMASDYNQIHLLAVCRNETHCTGFDSGFDSAQPTPQPTGSGLDSMQPTDNVARSLSRWVSGAEPGVETCVTDSHNSTRSLSGVEGNYAGTGDKGIVD